MKKFILFYLFATCFLASCCAKQKRISQYKAYCDDADTTDVVYTFKDNLLYIDEIGNEGFCYAYKMDDRNLSFYDELWGIWYHYKIDRKSNGDIIIKGDDCDILLKKQNKIIDLDFN